MIRTIRNAHGRARIHLGGLGPRALLPWWKDVVAYHRAPVPDAYSPTESALNCGRFLARPRTMLHLLVFLFLVLVFIGQASIYWLAVIDDSYITFRFVDMFVQGHGWRYSPMGPRVEGFTTFLWAVLLIIPHWLGWDLMYVAKLLGMGSGIATMAASWALARVVRRRDDLFNMIPPALLATNSYFAHWALMGMETLLQCALVTACYWRFEAERRDLRLWQVSPLLALLAALTRIDSIYYLMPLGIYSLFLLFANGFPLRRLVRWSVIAAVPFLLFWGWKWTYFGDPLPNTYYAKQRHVVLEGHGRAKAQFHEFYLNQGDLQKREPVPWSRIGENTSHPAARRIERLLWVGTFAHHNSLLWMNLWALSGLLTLAAVFGPLMRRHRKGGDSVRERLLASGSLLFLVLAPWALNFYYVYHVNADWMPSYRFFLVALPFIGVAAAVGFSLPARALRSWLKEKWARRSVRAACLGVAGYLLVANAYEHAFINSVSVYGPQSIFAGWRAQFWYLPSEIVSAYRKGFVPPLRDVSDYLLLNTQDDAWIYMHDIGQPLWFCEHLNLYDADGLTDPVLAHAPSQRGGLPRLRDIYDQVLREQGIEKAGGSRRKELMHEAKVRQFHMWVRRNADWLMNRRRPEYLIIFVNHARPDPRSPGWAYPDISREVYNHPVRTSEYVEQSAFPKIGNVYNHIYRRSDVEEEVPGRVRVERLLRAIKRNPRMPYLVAVLFREAGQVEDLPLEMRVQVREVVEDALERWSHDPAVAEIGRAAVHSNDPELAKRGLLLSIERSPKNLAAYFTLAGLYQRDKEFDAAIEVMWRADRMLDGEENSPLYQLIWLNEQAGDIDEARRVAKLAVARNPRDARAWSDYGAMLERTSRDRNRTAELRIALKQEALEAFEGMIAASDRMPDHLPGLMSELRAEIEELERELGIRPPEVNDEPAVPSAMARPETDYSPPNPQSRIPSPETDYSPPNPQSRIPSPQSRIPSPESRIPSPESRIPSPETNYSPPLSGGAVPNRGR